MSRVDAIHATWLESINATLEFKMSEKKSLILITSTRGAVGKSSLAKNLASYMETPVVVHVESVNSDSIPRGVHGAIVHSDPRSEEHTSELQSQSNLVCRLLLEKKKSYTPPRGGKLRTRERVRPTVASRLLFGSKKPPPARTQETSLDQSIVRKT